MTLGFENHMDDKSDTIVKLMKIKEEFDKDTMVVSEQSELFVKAIHPSYFINTKEEVIDLTYNNSDILLDRFTFYRIISCTIDNVDDIFKFLNEKMNKFFTVIHSLGKPIVYGIISYQGVTNLVIGVYEDNSEASNIKQIMEGLLSGIELCSFSPNLSSRNNYGKSVGLISAIPSIKIGDEKQKFDISSLMKSLNGQNYTVLFIARPVNQELVSNKYGEIIQIRDACFAVSKRNISRQKGISNSIGEIEGYTENDSYGTTTTTTKTETRGSALSFLLGVNDSHSRSKSESEAIQHTHSISQNYSKTITDSINNSEGIAYDIQNGFALEMISYADKAIDRFKQGRSNGMWETVITYSADLDTVAGVIRACISGEIAKPNSDILPQVIHNYSLTVSESENNSILVPKIIMEELNESPLCTMLTSEELGLICTLPSEPVPNFELKRGKLYPIITDNNEGIQIGILCDGKRKLMNMPYRLSYKDLARHTFVCGITGSGKTTTVKSILGSLDIPFLVIESAKKEYRNIKLKNNEHPVVYTLGKPEINCIRFNPFYIQYGVSLQMHIDFLKDLFNASFSFYGPMPYILEKCLYNIYRKKGWNLTFGIHPYLVNMDNSSDLFEAEYMLENYKKQSHKYIFPTMQDLKDEIERYIENDMKYDGELASNIKTAIKIRLESLCTGSKGYMFNTYDYVNMDDLLNKNVVFELEGLSDDSDKAFCVGMLLIFINEYRQVTKESIQLEKELEHILVIEEAHRLLKNVNIENSSENVGNPKGKAVEHFTNMIAEMRSYGQGVIIAEQIPSKLAPDVIKNSSNKIIHRIVSCDDQYIVGNTIGLQNEESIYIGSLKTGMALCHKEGMSLPVCINISQVEETYVSDGMLYSKNIVDRLHCINYNLTKEVVLPKLDILALKLLNTILIQDYIKIRNGIRFCRKQIKSLLIKGEVELVLCEDENLIYAELLCESVLKYLLNGVYSIKHLIDNDLRNSLISLLLNPNEKRTKKVKSLLNKVYRDDPAYRGKFIICQMLINKMNEKTDIPNSIRNYFFEIDEQDVLEICSILEDR